ncbi:hypothetical protein OFC23_30420, partial [Escherichia coli]|nr:hypothetical protein [Escherichia coli]
RRFVVSKMLSEENTEHLIEKALHGEAFLQDLRRMPSIRHIPVATIRVETDKYTRALSWANLAAEGRVFLVRGGWIADFIDEVCRF